MPSNHSPPLFLSRFCVNGKNGCDITGHHSLTHTNIIKTRQHAPCPQRVGGKLHRKAWPFSFLRTLSRLSGHVLVLINYIIKDWGRSAACERFQMRLYHLTSEHLDKVKLDILKTLLSERGNN